MFSALAQRSCNLLKYSTHSTIQKKLYHICSTCCIDMSYRSGGAGGYRHKSGRGGPNRGGGRGRGRGRGRGGGPPPGLSGKEIGMFYARRSKEKKKEKDRNERAVVTISSHAEQNISQILQDVRRSSQTSQTGLSTVDGDCASMTSMGSSSLAATLSGQSSSTGLSSMEEVDGLSGDIQSTDLDERLKEDLLEKQRNNRTYQTMMEFRTKLPSWQVKDEVLRLVKENQVTVISGETGCGKTTQVPQFILDEAITSGHGSRCHVICTQPRRISAISVAQRVAKERGESLGESSGFQIRLENKLPRTRGSILYCTTGVLLRRLIGDPMLSEVTHVIMDEVHERNISSDFLAIIMRDLLLRRPELKLILMSATLNAELFSTYFNNAPMFTIPNVVFPVAEYYLEDILKITRFNPPVKNERRRPYWSRFGAGRSSYEDQQREEDERQEYITSLETTKTYPQSVIESLRNYDEKEINLNLVLALIRYICTSLGEGAILVFLPGWDTISKLNDMLKSNPVFRSSRYLIIPLHSMMPTAFQQQVFDRPPDGVRKIVIATNIAETSITIDDVVYVVDCGKVKETTYDAANQLACLDAVWVSKAAARQRRGRAGRVQAGHCFHLFSKYQQEKLAEFQMPEMLRTPLEELVLQIKILQLGEARSFLLKSIEPPSDKAVMNAIKCLKELNALTSDERLTPLGHHLANLPVNPRIGKIILFGAIFSCLDPVLTIASALGFKEPFVIPLNKQEEADAQKKRFAGDTRSDHIALLRAFQGWEHARSFGNAKGYSWDNFLSNSTLELLRNMKQQFAGLLYDVGFIPSSNPKEDVANVNSKNLKLVKAVLCSGLYPNVVKLDQRKPEVAPKLWTQNDGKVKFHPKSVNCDEVHFDNKFMIYHTKVKSSAVFIHDASMIPPFPLLFFGGKISMSEDQGQEIISVDDWIVFQAPKRIAELVKEMRQELDTVLRHKVAHPAMELYTPHSPAPSSTSQLIQAIIDLITTEDYTAQAARLAAGKHLYTRRRY